MSLDEIDRIARNAQEVRDALSDKVMGYDQALDIDAKLAAITIFVDDVKDAYAGELKNLREIIDGLLANWPHTEITSYYTPTANPILTKHVALERAAAIVRSC